MGISVDDLIMNMIQVHEIDRCTFEGGMGGVFFSIRKSNLFFFLYHICSYYFLLLSMNAMLHKCPYYRPTWPSRRSVLSYTRSPPPPSSLTRPGSDITSLNAFCKLGWRQRGGQGLLNYWEFGLPVSIIIISLPSISQGLKGFFCLIFHIDRAFSLAPPPPQPVQIAQC